LDYKGCVKHHEVLDSQSKRQLVSYLAIPQIYYQLGKCWIKGKHPISELEKVLDKNRDAVQIAKLDPTRDDWDCECSRIPEVDEHKKICFNTEQILDVLNLICIAYNEGSDPLEKMEKSIKMLYKLIEYSK